MADLILYGDVEASRSWWVAWVCREAGLAFDNEAYGFLDPVLKSQAYLSINPNGLIPSLRDGDFIVWESLAINLYLAKKYASDLYPQSAEGEALAWQWSIWAALRELPWLVVAAEKLDLRPGSTMERYFLRHVPRWTPDEIARCRAILERALQLLDNHLQGQVFLLGERFSVADLNVAAILSFNQLAEMALPQSVHRWLSSCWSRSACPRRDGLLEFLNGLGEDRDEGRDLGDCA